MPRKPKRQYPRCKLWVLLTEESMEGAAQLNWSVPIRPPKRALRRRTPPGQDVMDEGLSDSDSHIAELKETQK